MISKMKTWMLLGGIALLLNTGCGTTPVPHERETTEYSGNDETAGILGFLGDGSLEISDSALASYNSYIGRQGRNLLPPIESNYGITPLESGSYSMSKEAFQKWKKMELLEERERINKAK